MFTTLPWSLDLSKCPITIAPPLLPQAHLWGIRKIRCTSNKWELEMHCSILDVAARVKDLSSDLLDLPRSVPRLSVVVLNITVKSSVGILMRFIIRLFLCLALH